MKSELGWWQVVTVIELAAMVFALAIIAKRSWGDTGKRAATSPTEAVRVDAPPPAEAPEEDPVRPGDIADEQREAPLPVDPKNPPRLTYYQPSGTATHKCDCHGRPLHDGQAVILWPNPATAGALWLICPESVEGQRALA